MNVNYSFSPLHTHSHVLLGCFMAFMACQCQSLLSLDCKWRHSWHIWLRTERTQIIDSLVESQCSFFGGFNPQFVVEHGVLVYEFIDPTLFSIRLSPAHPNRSFDWINPKTPEFLVGSKIKMFPSTYQFWLTKSTSLPVVSPVSVILDLNVWSLRLMKA